MLKIVGTLFSLFMLLSSTAHAGPKWTHYTTVSTIQVLANGEIWVSLAGYSDISQGCNNNSWLGVKAAGDEIVGASLIHQTLSEAMQGQRSVKVLLSGCVDIEGQGQFPKIISVETHAQ